MCYMESGAGGCLLMQISGGRQGDKNEGLARTRWILRSDVHCRRSLPRRLEQLVTFIKDRFSQSDSEVRFTTIGQKVTCSWDRAVQPLKALMSFSTGHSLMVTEARLVQFWMPLRLRSKRHSERSRRSKVGQRNRPRPSTTACAPPTTPSAA